MEPVHRAASFDIHESHKKKGMAFLVSNITIPSGTEKEHYETNHGRTPGSCHGIFLDLATVITFLKKYEKNMIYICRYTIHI